MNTTELADYFDRAQRAIREAKTGRDVNLAGCILMEPAYDALPQQAQDDLTEQYKRRCAALMRA